MTFNKLNELSEEFYLHLKINHPWIFEGADSKTQFLDFTDCELVEVIPSEELEKHVVTFDNRYYIIALPNGYQGWYNFYSLLHSSDFTYSPLKFDMLKEAPFEIYLNEERMISLVKENVG